jgi:arginine decarboxylase
VQQIQLARLAAAARTESGEAYRIGFFMLGAYQDALGDIHRLLGDTDTVNVRVDGKGYRFERARRSVSADVMLDYVG